MKEPKKIVFLRVMGFLGFFLLFCYFLNVNVFDLYAQQIPVKKISPPKAPKNINASNDPILIENLVVSNDINMQYTIRLKNNTSDVIPLKKIEAKIFHYNRAGATWVPSIELLQPSINTVIQPQQEIELIYRCRDDAATVLRQLDNNILAYNSENKARACIRYSDKNYCYEGEFLWKPKLADLRINDAKIEYKHEISKSGFNHDWFRFNIVLENSGDALPIFIGNSKRKTVETNFLKALITRKKDNKVVAMIEAHPVIGSQRENSLDTYLDTYFRINPGEKRELVFETDNLTNYVLDLIGEFEITIGFDCPLEKTNVVYQHLFGDANWQNNIIKKDVTLGNDLFEIISFFPDKISKIEPAEKPQGEFPRMEQDLMYIDLKSYLILSHLDDAKDVKIYFNDEDLRIFNIKIKGLGGQGEYRVWFKKPEKRERGRFKVEILGISRLADKYLEITSESKTAPSKIELPYYFDSTPANWLNLFPSAFTYGLMPINIEGVNIKGNAPVNFLVAVRSKDYTWLEQGKSWSDVNKDNPNADLSKYVSSLSSNYQIYLFIRAKDKLQWRDIGKLISPKTLEANKREVVTFTLDEAKALLEKKLTSGENEFLILVTYTTTEEKEKIEVPSDMYWSKFTLK